MAMFTLDRGTATDVIGRIAVFDQGDGIPRDRVRIPGSLQAIDLLGSSLLAGLGMSRVAFEVNEQQRQKEHPE